MRDYRTITRQEWETAKRHGYTSISNGQRYVLALDRATQATVLEPVRVVPTGFVSDEAWSQ